MTKKEKRELLLNDITDAISAYKNRIRKDLMDYDELPLNNGYDEEDEPLVIIVPDDDGYGVIRYDLDKARVENGNVQFHAVAINDREADEWIEAYYLGTDEIYAMENIMFPEDEDNGPNE